MSEYLIESTLTEMNCGECAGTYAISEQYRKYKEKNRGSWNCPYCKSGWGYSHLKKKDEDSAQIELARRKTAKAEAEAWEAKQEAERQKSIRVRLQARVKNGACPCCNRTFQNLHKHIKTKHPEWGSIKSLKSVRVSFGLTQNDLASELKINPSYVSLAERGKSCPQNAQNKLDEWIKEATQ